MKAERNPLTQREARERMAADLFDFLVKGVLSVAPGKASLIA